MEHLFTKNFTVESKIVEKYNMIAPRQRRTGGIII